MPLTRSAAALVGVLLLVPALNAQDQPDFSGRWFFVADGSTPSGQGLYGPEFTVALEGSTLTLDYWDYVSGGAFVPGRGTVGRTTTRGSRRREVYRLDGSEVRGESGSRATWAGPQLVITAYRTENVSWPQPWLKREMVRHTLSLNADGSLVVERQRIMDPNPWITDRQQPVRSWRSVYRK